MPRPATCRLYLLARHFHALLLGASVVVLGLHLEEGDVAVHIGPHAYLLPGSVPVVVLQVEEMVGSIPISGHVTGYHASVNALGIVFALRHGEQPDEVLLAGHELRVGPVHQSDARHLLQRDGLQSAQQFQYPFFCLHRKTALFYGKCTHKKLHLCSFALFFCMERATFAHKL